MEYSGYVEPGGYDQVVFRGDPTIRPIQNLVLAGCADKTVDMAKLADPSVPWRTCSANPASASAA